MSPEVQRIAIAEACGWRDIHEGVNCVTNPKGEKVFFNTLETHWEEIVPDYCTDLNAMHEAENVIPRDLRGRYLLTLEATTANAEKKAWPEVCATAAQRAEAFLRTIGKWDASASGNLSTLGTVKQRPTT